MMAQSWWRDADAGLNAFEMSDDDTDADGELAEDEFDLNAANDSYEDDEDDERPRSNRVDLITGAYLYDRDNEDDAEDSDEEDAADNADVLRRMWLVVEDDVEHPQRLFPQDRQRGGTLNRTVNRVDLNNVSRFQIENSWRQLSDVFNMYGTVYEIKPNIYNTAQDFMTNVRLFLTEVFDYMGHRFNPSDQISLLYRVGF